jgi:hypothetical protein
MAWCITATPTKEGERGGGGQSGHPRGSTNGGAEGRGVGGHTAVALEPSRRDDPIPFTEHPLQPPQTKSEREHRTSTRSTVSCNRTFTVSSSRTLLLTCSARAQVDPTTSESDEAFSKSFCNFGAILCNEAILTSTSPCLAIIDRNSASCPRCRVQVGWMGRTGGGGMKQRGCETVRQQTQHLYGRGGGDESIGTTRDTDAVAKKRRTKRMLVGVRTMPTKDTCPLIAPHLQAPHTYHRTSNFQPPSPTTAA